MFPDAILGLLVVGPDDQLAAMRPHGPGSADPYILRSLLRQEIQNEQIIALLTDIRDRVGVPATLIEAQPIQLTERRPRKAG